MSSTYETLAEFARSGGTIYCFVLFLGVLVYALWPAERRNFQEGGRVAAARGLSDGDER